tara:strand:- start:3510 stop:4097 length:588 start_codon:yes stop_codon:yes gene_type:complete
LIKFLISFDAKEELKVNKINIIGFIPVKFSRLYIYLKRGQTYPISLLPCICESNTIKFMDTVSAKKRSEIMSKIKSRDSKIEVSVRKFLFSKGLRFRKNVKNLPGCPDIVLPKYKTIVFVHGCFWHGHNCKYSRVPKTRKKYWSEKLKGNHLRDLKNTRKLRSMGWSCLVVWECKLKKNFEGEMSKLEKKIITRS